MIKTNDPIHLQLLHIEALTQVKYFVFLKNAIRKLYE